MKKTFILLFLFVSNLCLFAKEFVFPPELKWWLDEIQLIDKNASLDKFEFVEETTLLEFDAPVSYKNRLYPVLKKWNYFGDKFAYYSIDSSLKKNKSGKYSFESGEPDSQFGIFDKNENLLVVDFFGSSSWLDSFCWVRDNRITAVGEGFGKENDAYCFSIYDYHLKNGTCVVKKYAYSVNNPDLSKLKLRWQEQRSDYFE